MEIARKIAAIGAVTRNGVFGIGADLLWSDPVSKKSLLPLDMGRFVQKTRKDAPEGKQNVLIVGRATAESFDNKPLPKRHLVVLSRQERPSENGLIYATSIEEALAKVKAIPDAGDIFFAGGEAVWNLGIKHCTHAYITVVEKNIDITPEMHISDTLLAEKTWQGFLRKEEVVNDKWGEEPVQLTFIDYTRYYQ